jgi:hypothetical protein
MRPDGMSMRPLADPLSDCWSLLGPEEDEREAARADEPGVAERRFGLHVRRHRVGEVLADEGGRVVDIRIDADVTDRQRR